MPAFSAGPLRRHVAHQSALLFIQIERAREIWRHRLNRHTEPAARDRPLGLQFRNEVLHQVHWNGEANSNIAAALTEHGRINSNHLAIHVEKRSAGVSRIDRCIGLNEIIVRTGTDGPALCADDSRRDVLVKPKGLPIAITQSPTLSSSELPKFALGSMALESILRT